MMHHLDVGFTICSFLVSICCYDTVASVTLPLSELHFLLAASVEKPEAEWVAMTEVTYPQINWSLIDYLTAIDHPKWCWKILVQKYKGICFNFLHYLASMYYQFSSVRRIVNGRDFCQNKKGRLATQHNNAFSKTQVQNYFRFWAIPYQKITAVFYVKCFWFC